MSVLLVVGYLTVGFVAGAGVVLASRWLAPVTEEEARNAILTARAAAIGHLVEQARMCYATHMTTSAGDACMKAVSQLEDAIRQDAEAEAERLERRSRSL